MDDDWTDQLQEMLALQVTTPLRGVKLRPFHHTTSVLLRRRLHNAVVKLTSM